MKFITEIFNRFRMKSPSFFRVIQWLSVATAAITGLPALIAQFQTELGITLPDWIITFSDKAVAIAAIVAWVIAKLPVDNPNKTKLTSDGVKPLLPFTKKF